jgi:hypothetical protein
VAARMGSGPEFLAECLKRDSQMWLACHTPRGFGVPLFVAWLSRS